MTQGLQRDFTTSGSDYRCQLNFFAVIYANFEWQDKNEPE